MMNFTTLKKWALLAAAIAPVGYFSTIPAAAQEATGINSGLYENQAYIRGCRATNVTAQVYDNANLSPVTNRIGTLPPNTQVTLTGVLAPGRAQIFLEDETLSAIQPVGWIDAAALGPCETAATPNPAPSRECFRADVPLNVRSRPTVNAARVASYNQGSVIYTTTEPPTTATAPAGWPDYGRVWLEVSLNNGDGWIARTGRSGAGSNLTPIVCP